MTITLLRGLPGSGKSRHLVETINAAHAAGRPAHTFVCSEFPWPSNHGAFWVHRRLVCRQPGLTCSLDHFVSPTEAGELLNRADPGSLVGVEEAYAFGTSVVADWVTASERGLDLIAAAPSYQQVQLLKDYEYEELDLSVDCQRCETRNATKITIRADGEGTLSVCDPCFDELALEARREIVRCLRDEHPFPGEDALYQPIDLPEVAGWRLARPDTTIRAQTMSAVLETLDPPPSGDSAPPTYLDIGCNTGLFCDYFSRRGYRAKGVDATKRFITVARLLDSFFRRETRPGQEFVLYECANAYEYLRDTQQERFDVTSAFAVFQWVMIQRGAEHGLECIEWLAAKTKRVCFLEMGYTREEMYRDQLGVEIDRDWVLSAMRERGDFSEIDVVDAKTDGLQRDLFIGIKEGR